MPIQYKDSIMDAVKHCRENGSIFDVSHMCGLTIKVLLYDHWAICLAVWLIVVSCHQLVHASPCGSFILVCFRDRHCHVRYKVTLVPAHTCMPPLDLISPTECLRLQTF